MTTYCFVAREQVREKRSNKGQNYLRIDNDTAKGTRQLHARSSFSLMSTPCLYSYWTEVVFQKAQKTSRPERRFCKLKGTSRRHIGTLNKRIHIKFHLLLLSALVHREPGRHSIWTERLRASWTGIHFRPTQECFVKTWPSLLTKYSREVLSSSTMFTPISTKIQLLQFSMFRLKCTIINNSHYSVAYKLQYR
jgi:hypothetical protein